MNGVMDPASFRRLWKELKKLGWKDRAAPGDETGWLYIRPGKTFKGERGVDVFVGPEAVLEFVKRGVFGYDYPQGEHWTDLLIDA